MPALAAEYAHATVLGSGTATAGAVLAALDGAGLAHIAAHGTFRADSPLFSSLRMDDGPLTVHDLERLRRAPYRVILPSCDSGVLAPAGADELLGLAHTLAPRGDRRDHRERGPGQRPGNGRTDALAAPPSAARHPSRRGPARCPYRRRR